MSLRDAPDPHVRAERDDESFVERLVELDESMASGKPREGPIDDRLRRAADCLETLERLWSSAAPMSLESPIHTPPAGDANELPFRIGRFTIEREIGRGGFGVVFVAYDTLLERKVALKVPRIEALVSADHRQRFLLEARAAGLLSHPNVVQVHEAGQVGPICYIASAYHEGTTLAGFLACAAKPLPPIQVARLTALLADALAHAHGRGILHRDLKPANVLLEPTHLGTEGATAVDMHGNCQTPRLTDFGLAKLLSRGDDDRQAIIGTPAYMAPEQVDSNLGEVGPAADVYGLGAVMYELLTGRQPIEGVADRSSLSRIATQAPIRPRRLRHAVPADLEAICLKCLEKRWDRRYATAADLAADLRRFIAGESVSARPEGVGLRVEKWVRRRPMVAALGLLLVAIMAAYPIAQARMAAWTLDYDRTEQWRAQAVAMRYQSERREQEIERKYLRSTVQLAQRALSDSNVVEASELLDEHAANAEKYVRGFGWGYLWRLCHGEPRTLDENALVMRCLAFSADEEWLAGGGEDGVMKVWHIDTDADETVRTGHVGDVRRIEFIGEGKVVATGGEDGTVRVRSLDSPSDETVIDPKLGAIHGLMASSNGQRLAIAGAGGVTVLDTASWSRLMDYRPPSAAEALSVALSDDGELIAVGSSDGNIYLVDSRTGSVMRQLNKTGGALSMDFSRDGQSLIAGGNDKIIRVWDLATGVERIALRGHHAIVTWVEFVKPDESTAFSVSARGSLVLWDVETGIMKRFLRAHRGSVACIRSSSQGNRVVTAGLADRMVKLWDTPALTTQCRVEGLTAPVSRVAFAPDESVLATAGSNNEITLWDPTSGRNLGSLGGHYDRVTSIAFSHDSAWLASSSLDHSARVWDMATRRELCRTPRQRMAVTAVAISPDREQMATGRADGAVQWWSLPDCSLVRRVMGHSKSISALAYSPDGRMLISGAPDGKICLWDAEGGSLTATYDDAGRVATLAFAPDGASFAAAGGDTIVRLYRVESSQPPQLLEGHTDEVNALSFSPEGGTLASASADGTIGIWNMQSQELFLRLEGHTGAVNSVAFSRDGTTLASGGSTPDDGGEIYLWFASDVR